MLIEILGFVCFDNLVKGRHASNLPFLGHKLWLRAVKARFKGNKIGLYVGYESNWISLNNVSLNSLNEENIFD